jgi:hypothetical protein
MYRASGMHAGQALLQQSGSLHIWLPGVKDMAFV